VSASDEILRFRKSERQLHWAIAIPFMASYATAVILVVVYNPNPARPLRDLVSWAHRISGICLIVLPLWTIVRHRPDLRVYLHNIRHAWTWTWDDVRWLFLMGPSVVNKKIALPDQGKFNAAEKINFMVLVSTYPAYIVTGVLIWLPGVAYLSWLLHFSMAVAATPLMLGHIFMATVNPDTRVGLSGMISGFVDRQWAKHHYRRWYEEHFERPVEVVPVIAVRSDTQPRSAAVAHVVAAPRDTQPRPAAVAHVVAAPRDTQPPRPVLAPDRQPVADAG
jgi:formate dehydrogenase gamma subunit